MPGKTILSSKIFILSLLICLAFLANLKFKQWRSQSATEKEKAILIQQTEGLEQKNRELSQSLSYMSSGGFKEKLARQQLNLKRDGEIVYNFTSNANSTSTQEDLPSSPQSNLQKWWQYFFSTN